MTPRERQLTPPGGWIPSSGARLAPAPLRWWEHVLVWMARHFTKVKQGDAELPVIFTTLLRNRKLFYAWLRFAARLMPGASIGRRDAELVILRAGWNTRCRYEWGQHVEIGLRAGLTPQQIARIAQGPQAPGWEPHQQALLLATDEMIQSQKISDDTWTRLAARYREPQLIEISLLIGHYQMLAGVLNSLGLELEDSVERVLAATPIHE